jgi:uncharacterized protein YdaU (DUF1376 family)
LLLMLDYYATGEPAPDDDDTLAAITKLPVETWQNKYRKILEPYFKIDDGRWFHSRIETELRIASNKHSAAVSRARVAAGVRWSKDAPGNAKGRLQTMPPAIAKQSPSRKRASSNSTSIDEALPKPSRRNRPQPAIARFTRRFPQYSSGLVLTSKSTARRGRADASSRLGCGRSRLFEYSKPPRRSMTSLKSCWSSTATPDAG